MAADTSSLTLSDYALMSNDPLVKKITMSMLRLGSVLQDIPLQNSKTMIQNGVRFVGAQGNATPAWRALNGIPPTTKGVPVPWQEQAYIMSNNFDVDNVLLEDKNAIQDPFTIQINHFLEMVVYEVNDKFINNNHLSGDVNAPVGLRYRLDNAATYGIPTEMKYSAAATDVSAGSNVPKLCFYIDNLLIRMGAPEGDGVVLYMDEGLKTLIDFGLKLAGTAGGFRTVTDVFDRSITQYKNAKIRIIGRKSDQSTHIVTTTEDTAGVNASSTYTSIYAVRYGDGYFSGWEFRSLEQAFTGPFLLNSGVQQRLNFDWPVGLLQEHTRAIGRIYDIKVA